METPLKVPAITSVTPCYETAFGTAYLGDSFVLTKELQDDSLDLVLTSPPFALTRKKEYGNEEAAKYVDWIVPLMETVYRKLKPRGSLVLDLGGAYLPGSPTKSIYQYQLLVRLCTEVGFHLAQDFFHYNPARLPAPAEWVNIRRIRVKDSVNVVWWLSKTQDPKADNRRVLRPYSPSMKALLRNGYKAMLRPSGHDISDKFGKDNGGAVPPNVIGLPTAPENMIEIANTESNSDYMRACKQHGVKPHPARFPPGFAEFFISFLTEPGDLVLDPFAGSNTTGYVAETLGRTWLSFELRQDYLSASAFRFSQAYGGSPLQPQLLQGAAWRG